MRFFTWLLEMIFPATRIGCWVMGAHLLWEVSSHDILAPEFVTIHIVALTIALLDALKR